ncbi:hypothetical protein [Acinetobacter baumannii]
MLVTCLNLGNVKFYGESEFWLAIIKVAAVISMSSIPPKANIKKASI